MSRPSQHRSPSPRPGPPAGGESEAGPAADLCPPGRQQPEGRAPGPCTEAAWALRTASQAGSTAPGLRGPDLPLVRSVTRAGGSTSPGSACSPEKCPALWTMCESLGGAQYPWGPLRRLGCPCPPPHPPAAACWKHPLTYGARFDFEMAFKASREEKELPLGTAARLGQGRVRRQEAGLRDLGQPSSPATGVPEPKVQAGPAGAPVRGPEGLLSTAGLSGALTPTPRSPTGPGAPCCWAAPDGRRSAGFSAGFAHRP